MKIFKIIKDILSPKKCYSCNKEWHFLCKKCFEKLDNYNDFCYVCKKKSKKFEVHKLCKKEIYYDNLIVLTHYKNNLIKKLIINFKFYWKKDIAEDFAILMANKLLKTNLGILNNKDVLIISSPMSFFRKLKKWYNQSELLAKEISNILWIEYNSKIIKKIKKTKQQASLSRENRLKNIKNAFKINKKYIDNIDKKTIILIDDVVSTWSTINEISKLLKKYRASKVIWLCIASD